MEFRINRKTRDQYQIDPSFFLPNGNVFFSDLKTIREFIFKVNQQQNLVINPDKAIKTSQFHGMGLIDDIFRHVFVLYLKEKNPQALETLVTSLQYEFGADRLDEFLCLFVSRYPSLEVYQNRVTPFEFLSGWTKGTIHRELILENLILFWISTRNPAMAPFSDLICDPEISGHVLFNPVMDHIETKLALMPGFGPENQSLIEMLRSPAIHSPHSITGQLEYIRDHWAFLLGDFLYKLLTGLDLAKEEEKLGFMGPGPVIVPVYDEKERRISSGQDIDIEAFSQDKDWMPRLVLIAKNIFVWLDQLSRQYGYAITTLDQIPDEELQALSSRGITGLWLIGLWQRSPASARIKQLCGNPEAVSSAYSLYSYKIADVLGGDAACQRLKEKAARYGIRLASDMVPNHMGIDSEWVIQHPEWFLSVDESPFPSYSFTGPDLSSDENIQIQIEDHYYDKSDAAVVFRRIDKRSGQTKYIYHGNDGTSMPWNDTAQLNYLDPAVREQVIETIIEVARKFPIIRFDAAMTLAKKHIQRLWYPEPGSGGAIPSRSAFALSKADFDRAIPHEFWREVVERIEVEVPDTLLLAEAFWLMEGYFVRTLGMHRVYNSAFMHMLRNEDNAGYRSLMKNTLEFEPEILKRFVNFMNNPDERTAVEQFGSGDKYFGICTLMTTMPGLPMFGHGQIEGFTEKYGMEYSKALYDERADDALVQRHFTEIIPLLYQRELFASVDHFRMYDFILEHGQLNENVFAFTNKLGDRRTLVIYNNSFQETQGRIKEPVLQSTGKKSEKARNNCNIASALGIRKNETGYLLFHDLTTNQNYLRPINELIHDGFYFHLNGYEHHAFVDFRIVHSGGRNDYDQLYAIYGHSGIVDIDQAINEIRLQPILHPLREICNAGYLNYLHDLSLQHQKLGLNLSDSMNEKTSALLNGVSDYSKGKGNLSELQAEIVRLLEALVQLPQMDHSFAVSGTKNISKILTKLVNEPLRNKARWYTLSAWVIFSRIGKVLSPRNYVTSSLACLDEWKLEYLFADVCRTQGISEADIQRSFEMLRLLILFQDWFKDHHKKPISEILQIWFSSIEVQIYLKFNRFEGTLWYDHEAFQEFIWWMEIIPILQTQSKQATNRVTIAETILALDELFKQITTADKKSDCKVEKLIQIA